MMISGYYYLSTSIIKNNASSSNSPRHGLRFLKELSLRGVAMHNGEIMVLLRNLVVLERLLLKSLTLCYTRRYLGYDSDIDGPPTSKLQRLIISGVLGCWYAARASKLTNLISLRCDGMSNFDSLDLHNLRSLFISEFSVQRIVYSDNNHGKFHATNVIGCDTLSSVQGSINL